jgi:putative salt-induced outer membrane protein YdiY
MNKMSALAAALCTVLSGIAQAQQQPAQPDPNLWEQTSLSLGFQTYHGGSDSVSLNIAVDWLEQFEKLENEAVVNINLSQSEGSSLYQSEDLNWALRLTPAHAKRRWFPMAHVWFEHDEIAGVDFRGTAGPGIGIHLIDTAETRLTLEGGFARTVEKQIEDVSYNTIFFDPTWRWNINKKARLKSKLSLNLNGTEGGDVRLHSETDLNYQITQRVSLQNSVKIDYDNHPVPGHEKTDIQTSINVSFSIYSGTPNVD